MSVEKRVVVVIPARYASSRFPAKPLYLICGKPMIQWTYEQAMKAELVSQVVVATDDQRIFDCVKSFGGEVVMTSADHPSGTDRIAEVLENVEADLVVNVQGDEPTVEPKVIDDLVVAMVDNGAEMGTVAVPIDRDGEDFRNPNVVKLVKDCDGNALYFSRAPIPFCRDGAESVQPLKHWGLYAYTPELVKKFVEWPESALEKCEKLEQLRAVEHGVRIVVITAECDSVGVDTIADAEKVVRIIEKSL
jgi:3-deoxy-manno-octulosonate cytidylyltransferase (CMP-KDO synthetase)